MIIYNFRDRDETMLKDRNYDVDALKAIAIIMVITLHYLDKGGVLTAEEESVNMLANILESLSIIATNVFFLVSGYLLLDSKFKIKRFVELLFCTFFYSLVIGTIVITFVTEQRNLINIIKIIFPIGYRNNWFINNYIAIYLLTPFLNAFLRQCKIINIKKILIVLTILFSIWGCIPSFHPFNNEGGYGLLWSVTLYITGAYFKLTEKSRLKSRSYFKIYFLISICMGLYGYIMQILVENWGFPTLFNTIFYTYNNPVVYVSSVAFFYSFLVNGTIYRKLLKKFLPIISTITLDIYLIHDNFLIRDILWKRFFPYSKLYNIGNLILGLIVLIIIIIGVSLVFYKIRKFLWKKIENSIIATHIYKNSKYIIKKILAWDI